MYKSQGLTNANTCVAQIAIKIGSITITPENSSKPFPGNVHLNPLEASTVLMSFAYSRNSDKWKLSVRPFFISNMLLRFTDIAAYICSLFLSVAE